MSARFNSFVAILLLLLCLQPLCAQNQEPVGVRAAVCPADYMERERAREEKLERKRQLELEAYQKEKAKQRRELWGQLVPALVFSVGVIGYCLRLCVYRVENHTKHEIGILFQNAPEHAKATVHTARLKPGASCTHSIGCARKKRSAAPPFITVFTQRGDRFVFDLSPYFDNEDWDRKRRSFIHTGDTWPIIIRPKQSGGNEPILMLPMKTGSYAIVEALRETASSHTPAPEPDKGC